MSTASATIDISTRFMGKNLAKALFQAQQEIDSVEKGTDNPYFKSKYADLNTVIDVIKPALNKAGVLFVQAPVPPKFEGNLALETTLIHVASGETYSAIAEVPLAKSDPQGFGGAVTYTRRYALVALLGLKQEDDDGNAASNLPAKPQQSSTPAKRPAFLGKSNTNNQSQAKAPVRGKARLFPKVNTDTEEGNDGT